jgi:hypothetical protein
MKLKVDEKSKTIKKLNGGKFAPIEFTSFDDMALARLIRHKLKKYPELLQFRKVVELNPKYDVVDKNVHGPKFINKTN